jgi:threonine synthase
MDFHLYEKKPCLSEWIEENKVKRWSGIIAEYKEFLPINQNTPIITLQEGNTPLIEACNISEKLLNNKIKVYLKLEGCNPTGSFKDRGMTLAISKAKESDAKVVICASTGNTSASAAAYSARAGLACVVLIPNGAIALGKLAQALIHGAKVIAIEGSFDDALKMVQLLASQYPITIVNSSNIFRIEGQKTAAYEIVDALGTAPDYHFIPVGNAGNITAYWKGYMDYFNLKQCSSLPKMCGFQAAQSAPIVEKKIIEHPETIATAIKIGNPFSWKSAEHARDASGGIIESVTDEEILYAYEMLAQLEGVFCEPASAASVAGVIKKNKENYFRSECNVVCTLTGQGLKDPDRAVMRVSKPIVLKPELNSIIKVLNL